MIKDSWFTARGGRTFYWQWFIREIDEHYAEHKRIQIWFNWWRLPYCIKFSKVKVYS